MAGTPRPTRAALSSPCRVTIEAASRLSVPRGRLSYPVGTVLFVCVENTFRSVLSEALFNAIAPSGWRAESAGVQAATEINPVVPPLLREIGIELGPKKPRTVTPQMIAGATRVVTFGCLDRCPLGAREKAEDWPLPGAPGQTMEARRSIRY